MTGFFGWCHIACRGGDWEIDWGGQKRLLNGLWQWLIMHNWRTHHHHMSTIIMFWNFREASYSTMNGVKYTTETWCLWMGPNEKSKNKKVWRHREKCDLGWEMEKDLAHRLPPNIIMLARTTRALEAPKEKLTKMLMFLGNRGHIAHKSLLWRSFGSCTKLQRGTLLS